MKPQDIRNVLVAMERFELKVGGDEDLSCLDFEEFVEALFIVAMSSFSLPSSNQFVLPEVKKLYHKLEEIEHPEGEVSRSREVLPPQSKDKPQKKATNAKQTSGNQISASLSTPNLLKKTKAKPAAATEEHLPAKTPPNPQQPEPPQQPELPKTAEDGVGLFRRFVEELGIPKIKRDALKLIEERRQRYVLDRPRYWDGKILLKQV